MVTTAGEACPGQREVNITFKGPALVMQTLTPKSSTCPQNIITSLGSNIHNTSLSGDISDSNHSITSGPHLLDSWELPWPINVVCACMCFPRHAHFSKCHHSVQSSGTSNYFSFHSLAPIYPSMSFMKKKALIFHYHHILPANLSTSLHPSFPRIYNTPSSI